MAVKKTGISRDLVIHPGETIADVLENRGISQAELALRTGVSAAYVSNVIAGKKGISAGFASGLEYALGIPGSFWLNLQANYEAELLEINEGQTITDEERRTREELRDIVKYLRQKGMIPVRESRDDSILSLRKALQISNIANLRELVPDGVFRMAANISVNQNVLGAWIRLCQIEESSQDISARFEKKYTDSLVNEIKDIMCRQDAGFQTELKNVMKKYGIDFSIAKNFRGAPVQGYIAQKSNGVYQMVLTIRGAFADIFWFSLLHEIGHIVNGDVRKGLKFIDDGSDCDKETAADCFAGEKLLSPESYKAFIQKKDFSIEAIQRYAKTQNVMPYIVIGRLQKEGYLDYRTYSNYKLRYKWQKES
ncbi:addiction module antidote protein HigA [Marvinbryantia formatexigens DSM 14469]|uniref:Addiction module antidote protein HigA n=1 Tax=Marvinbryantia formatexigens DSM 14469 TaxID=478749 RepID=C6LFA5_9FIRM|nr:HigA family addiction module antitoxin [Marvinbryantia formatexigens]EET60844.1 addiction module antidote protein HigA [Marvinbryantia formatexigens DSM 14469]UWO26828.1 HigA family addiction module antitoxin [Marvinbryantia formatexigens DSM 14469]